MYRKHSPEAVHESILAMLRRKDRTGVYPENPYAYCNRGAFLWDKRTERGTKLDRNQSKAPRTYVQLTHRVYPRSGPIGESYEDLRQEAPLVLAPTQEGYTDARQGLKELEKEGTLDLLEVEL